MKKDIIQQYHIRKVTKPNEKRNTWNVNIPQEYVKILKLDQEYVQIQIIDDMVIIKKNKRSITKKDLEKMDSQNISEETTAHTINNEVKETQDEEYNRIEKERIEKILDDSLKEYVEKPQWGKQNEKDRIGKLIDDSLNQTSDDNDNTEEIKNILKEETEIDDEKDDADKKLDILDVIKEIEF